ncbi:MAG: Pyrophosphate--fructose 6-phosphate 1-phosphotransferase [Phycisphaerae bacterium]|nr:Pyrophosphate--fructose 6-phosphate 1-phosphotransferase [Phycisphaerae bacterium]
MAKSKGNAVVGQSGGPTCVINQSLVGVVEEFVARRTGGRILGMRHGVAGLVKGNLIDLTRVSRKTLDLVAATPSSALGSSRDKPNRDYCQQIFEVCRKNDIRWYFYIGGNDSADSARIVSEVARDASYDLRVFHIPKTIDNDLRENDHTPGFGSAARWVACAFMGDDLDNRSLPGVKINVVMGRNAGFLTAASILARTSKDAGPHLVYVPEADFDEARFVADVQKSLARIGRCQVAVSEGIHRKGEQPLAAMLDANAPVDSHGNKLLTGGALGAHLVNLVKAAAPKARVRADTFGYLQRCFPGVVSETDAREARQVGRLAARAALAGKPSGSVAIRRVSDKPYRVAYELVDLSKVARDTRHLPPKFINRAANDINDSFLAYVAPLAGKLPTVGLLG